jgi:hypothetical protein
MSRCVLAILLLLTAFPAAAQTFVCPRVTIGWAKQWPTSQITSASYDSGAKVIYIVQAHTIPEAYAQVPTSIITQFSNTQNPYQVYLQLRSQYPQILLTQKDNCPVFSTSTITGYVNPLFLQENLRAALQENGHFIYVTPQTAVSAGVSEAYLYLNTVPLNYFQVVLKENGGPLLQEVGNYLFLEKAAPEYGPYIGLAQENDGLIVQENYQPMLTY